MDAKEARHHIFRLLDAAESAGLEPDFNVPSDYWHILKSYVMTIPDKTSKPYSQDAKEQALRAILWAKENYTIFKRLRRLLVLEARDENRVIFGKDKDGNQIIKGYQSMGREEIYTISRYRGWDIQTSDMFKREHALYATLSRAIMMQRPITCRIIRTAKSKVDDVDIKALWLEHMPGEFFPVDTVAEARLACAESDMCAK